MMLVLWLQALQTREARATVEKLLLRTLRCRPVLVEIKACPNGAYRALLANCWQHE